MPAQCILPNGNFESGSLGWQLSSDAKVEEQDGSLTLNTDQAHGKQQLTVAGGTEFTLAFDVRGEDKSDEDKQPYVEIHYRNAGGSWFRKDRVWRQRAPKAWRSHEVTFEAPDEAVMLEVRIGCKDEKAYWDNLCLTSAGGACGVPNGDFAAGLRDWSTAGAACSAESEGGNPFLRRGSGWTSSPTAALIPGEEYEVTWRMRRASGTRTRTFASVKSYPAGSWQHIREHLLYNGEVTDEWATYTARFVAPVNATRGKFISSSSDHTIDLDDLCIEPVAQKYAHCMTGADRIASWTGSDIDFDRHKGRDAWRVDESEARHEFDVTSGTVYRLEFNYYGADESEDPSLIALAWLNSSGGVLSTTVLANQSFDERWQYFTRLATVPPGAVRARLRIGNADRKVYFNDVCLSAVGAPGAAGVVSGRVFADDNSDGGFSTGERSLAGATLMLFRDDGDESPDPRRDELVSTLLSSGLDVDYVFSGLSPGRYYVVGTLLPTKYISAFEEPSQPYHRQNRFRSFTYGGLSGGITDLFSVTATSQRKHVNLGQRPSSLSAVSGYVWADADGDGYRDEVASSGLNSIRVRAYRVSDDALLKTTYTADDALGRPGHYLFNFVDVTPVYVIVDLPGGASLRDRKAWTDNRNFDPGNGGKSDALVLLPNTAVSNVSAGLLVSTTEICDNGIDDDGDGRADLADSDCTSCVRRDEILCGEPFRNYIPPVWEMADPSGVTYVGPAYLLVTADTDSVVIRGATPDNSWSFERVARKGAELRIPIPTSAMQTAANNVVNADKGLIVESELPVNIVYFIDGKYNKALVTMKGEQALGNRFRAGSQTVQANCNPVNDWQPATNAPNVDKREAHFVSVMAVEDDTRVTFDWDTGVTTYDGLSSGTHAVTLDAGESYLLRDAYTNETVSGTGISSDKAIAVISGSQHTHVCDNYGLDAGIDQLVPECYVGTEYVAVKHQGRDNQHYVVVVPTEDNTAIYANGALVSTRGIQEYEQIMIAGAEGDPTFISTSAPASVYHVSGISTNNEVGMALAASFGDCRGNRYLSFAKGLDTAVVDRDLNIIVSAAAASSLRLNGGDGSVYPDITVALVPGRNDYVSVIVPGKYLEDVNTLEADDYFQAALLIGISGNSGTFGYLTSFAQSITVREPATGIPTPRYSLPNVCGAQSFSHALDVSSCGTRVQIVSSDNNTNLGTVSVTGDLTFDYLASAAGYGRDNVTLRLRDENGLEVSVCIDVFVCGSSVPMSGLPSSRSLSCGQEIPSANPIVASTDCPVVGAITFTDQRVDGPCAAEYQIVRTWRARTTCGTDIVASRTFSYEDTQLPTLTGVPASVTICAGEANPWGTPTSTDGCGAASVTFADVRTDEAGSDRYRILRTWTATDACGNTRTAQRTLLVLEAPRLTGSPTVRDATCGGDNGEVTLAFPDDANRSSVQFEINGTWRAAIGDDRGTVTYGGLAAGSYTLRARWGNGDCVVDLAGFAVRQNDARVEPLHFHNLTTGTKTLVIDGQTYDLDDDLPASWNLRADGNAGARSVEFVVSGGTVSDSHTENAYPHHYGGDPNPTTWGAGTYTVTTRAHATPAAGGPVCQTRTTTFTIAVDEICGDGIDNDGDGAVDCADGDCPPPTPVARVMPGP